MPDIRLRRRHGLGLADARRRVEDVARELAEEHPHLVEKVAWNDDRTAADVNGRGFRGRFALSEDEVAVDVDLGFLARPFRSRVETALSTRLEKHFA